MKTVKKKKTTLYDPAEYIKDKEDVIAHLEVALEENDIEFLFDTIGHIARSKGITKIAKEMKIDRKSLQEMLIPDGNFSFETVLKLLDVLGLQLKLVQKPAVKQPQAQAVAQL